MRLLPSMAVALLALLAAGCAPKIGDSCKTSADCALDGSRVCDNAQPAGYCTVQGCDPDGCPEDARCVEWRFDPPRTAQSWCMKSCSSNSSCRQSNGYRCVDVYDPALVSVIDGAQIARVIDHDNPDDATFCAAVRVPEVGDHCDDLTDCSADGSLSCTRCLPGINGGSGTDCSAADGDGAVDRGYCTVEDCSEGTCPEDSVCVAWRNDGTSGLEVPVGESMNFCMKSCGASIGCRTDEGYRCVDVNDPGLISTADSMPLATSVDTEPGVDGGPPVDPEFCAIAPEPDAGVPMVDAGMPMVDAGVDAGP